MNEYESLLNCIYCLPLLSYYCASIASLMLYTKFANGSTFIKPFNHLRKFESWLELKKKNRKPCLI